MNQKIEDLIALADLADALADGGFYLWQLPKHERRFDCDGFSMNELWRCKIGSGPPFDDGQGARTPDEAITAVLRVARGK